jgi:PIF1-like helicase
MEPVAPSFSTTCHDLKHDACAPIWTIIEPTLPPHVRDFARNIELLRKSNEDCRIDAALREKANAQDFFDQEVDDVDIANLDSDDDESSPEELTPESLIAAYHSIANSWHKELTIAAKSLPNISSAISPAPVLQLQSFIPLDVFQHLSHSSSGLQYFPPTTLQQWHLQIKSIAKLDDPDDGPALDLDDFNVVSGDGILHPALASAESVPNLADRRLQVGDCPTAATLIDLIHDVIPLNTKQRLIVERVLTDILSSSDASGRRQFFLYVGGEGGVGKSRIIKAITAAMDLIFRKDEVILMAPTGSSADGIDGNTYHTSLGISLAKNQKPTVQPRVRKLWSNKTVMFIDEISMVDLSMLSTIDKRCKIARSLDRTSTDLFGGLPIVIFMGDFYQFPPIKGPALLQEPRKGNEEDARVKWIWHQFTNVIMLNEQMRQAQDPAFRDFLGRARTATCTTDDVALLNSKVITSLIAPELQNATSMARFNSLRHI